MPAADHLKISPRAYQFIVDLVYKYSRIRLGPDKQSLITGRLIRRLRHHGLDNFEDYCALLRSAEGAEEITQLVDLISTNHTHFFREVQHMDCLRDRILPEWLPRLAPSRAPLKIWSAASSSGEEPYTIAIVLAEYARLRGPFPWQIEGSDISTRILEKATAAVYPADTLNKLPQPDLLPRYFQKGVGENEGLYRVRDTLRKNIHFHQLNLLQPSYPVAPAQHVIFCRNVMIYFDVPTQQELILKLIQQLAPGGYLIIGHSESLLSIKHPLKALTTGVYLKV